MLLTTARRLIVLVIGVTVLLIGLALSVLPGPALVVLPAGLAILGTEFAWARWLLRRIRGHAVDGIARIRRFFGRRHPERGSDGLAPSVDPSPPAIMDSSTAPQSDRPPP
ncbi:MAG: PGPGW domain-containing protein [Planctomycetota bacterium]